MSDSGNPSFAKTRKGQIWGKEDNQLCVRVAFAVPMGYSHGEFQGRPQVDMQLEHDQGSPTPFSCRAAVGSHRTSSWRMDCERN